MSTNDWEVYDDFVGGGDECWEERVVHDAAGTPFLLCDRTADVRHGDGIREVRIERFTRAATRIQNLDNPKHLVVSTRTFEVPDGGSLWFRADMAAEQLGRDGIDYRDGFATFNIIDIEHKLVFDFVTTGPRVHALYELQAAPVGVVAPEDSFLYVIDNPELVLAETPSAWHTFTVHLDPCRGRIDAFVDDRPLFRTRGSPRGASIGQDRHGDPDAPGARG